jgi:hypothetical protein
MILNLCISEEVLSLGLAKLQLGVEPRVPIDKSIREIVRFYRKQGLIYRRN